jgi:MSHA pilin protein MshC
MYTAASKKIQYNHNIANNGFSLVELVTVIVIAGILAAVAVPRMVSQGSFASRGFFDQAISTLRYAQKAAISQHQFVCITFTANSMSLTTGVTAACGTNLSGPDSSPAPYTVTNTSGAAFTAVPAVLVFDALGRPMDAAGVQLAANRTINVSGYGVPITIERETGYVHQ